MNQVWDQVKVVKAGDPHDGKAGLVVRVDAANDIAVVKLDGETDTTNFAAAELVFLGR